MIKKLLAAVLIGWCSFGNTSYAQKENYVWYFGDSAGIDFNSGNPVVLTSGVLWSIEGCASISDINGNILFYTNGVKVWDKNHNLMPNGYGLAGGTSSTQSALIIPLPGSNFIYYIFTVGEYENPPMDFNYSIVDMNLNGGNGDVTVKNSFIVSPVCEKLTATRHSNNTDVWVMVHGNGNNVFYCYLITASGLTITPVTTGIGSIINSYDVIGQMKFSPDGSKLAIATWSDMNLFDFNSNSGVVTNQTYLTVTGNPYGVEFSANGNYLYCSMAYSGTINQWDITSNSAAIINSTLQQIAASTADILGSLQLGPDKKIYVAEIDTTHIGVIINPDSGGASSNYVDNAIYLGGKTCGWGLPNFITSYFLPTGINTNSPQQNQLTIYPNPATDKIYISIPVIPITIGIKIFSITGEIKLSESFKTFGKLNAAVDVTGFSNGIYFLSVQTGREVVTKKIVVNH